MGGGHVTFCERLSEAGVIRQHDAMAFAIPVRAAPSRSLQRSPKVVRALPIGYPCSPSPWLTLDFWLSLGNQVCLSKPAHVQVNRIEAASTNLGDLQVKSGGFATSDSYIVLIPDNILLIRQHLG